MRLTASDFYTRHRPSECDLRVYLHSHGEPEEPDSPYEELIRRLGNRHEKSHLQTFPNFADLSIIDDSSLESRTRAAVAAKAPVIYQPQLRAALTLDGISCEVVGRPDFLILDAENYIIRDSKVSRRISEDDHPEIILQLQLYGWLYRQMFGADPARLEVHNGANQIVTVADDGGNQALAELKRILHLKLASLAPYSPVGWTKCGQCSFHKRCWTAAENKKDVALVAGIDQGLARSLYEIDIHNIKDFIVSFDEDRLSDFKKHHGDKLQRVGKRARSILTMAKAMETGEEIILAKPIIPLHSNYVMFDLEGLPPHLDDFEKIYLWGMQIFGETPAPFMPAIADFGSDGDRKCWLDFLSKAKQIFDSHGDLPFVHWHDYEKTKIKMYIDRFGDPIGIADRVLRNLLNILPITRDCIALPLSSYSLKVVEQYIGFKRTQEEYGGDWSMAKYIEAIETEDKELRQQVMDEILLYNQEDLAATWAVFQWLMRKAG